MAVRIRVYPMNGLANGAYGAQGGAVSASTFYNTKLQSQQQVSNLQLQYERALANEKIERVRLEERLKNPYAMAGAAGIGMPAIAGLPGLAGFGGLPMGGMGLPIGGMGMPMGGMPITGGLPLSAGVPMGLGGGAGQTNATNQSSAGGTQSVVNTNTNHQSSVQHPIAPGGWGGFGGGIGGFGGGFGGGGGFLSSLLGALI